MNKPKIEGMKVFVKSGVGPKDPTRRKEVLLAVNKSGLYSDGTQRWAIAFRFTDDAYKKASSTEYVGIGFDEAAQRVYFWSETKEDGYKLSRSSKTGHFRSVTTPCDNREKWEGYKGAYDLLKDTKSGCYYIDLAKR